VGALPKIFANVPTGLAFGGGVRLVNSMVEAGRIEGIAVVGASVGVGVGGWVTGVRVGDWVIGARVGGWVSCGAQFNNPKPGQSPVCRGH
jgi:hypothetical protein